MTINSTVVFKILTHTILVSFAASTYFVSPSAHAQAKAKGKPAVKSQAISPVKPLPAPPIAAKPLAVPKPQAVERAAWDDNYLYLTFQVDDVNIQGTQTAPMSQPQEDDSIGVYLDFGNGNAPSSVTHAMIVSAAGGFTFLRGDEATKGFVPRPLFTIKYAVTVQGTLNRSDDRDRGYTVEMAIPWAGIEQKPETVKSGFSFRYNAVVRSRGSKFSSLSPKAKTDLDITTPQNWSKMTLSPPGGGGSDGSAFALRVTAGSPPPLIDGVARDAEWSSASRLVFDAPEKSQTENAVVQAAPITRDTALPSLLLSNSLNRMDGRIFARYRVDFQGDTRKIAPFRGILSPTVNAFLLMDQPVNGVGPWFSSDRVGWHRANLSEMRRAGVDVALVTLPATTDIDASNDKALLTMVSALREMRFEAQSAPQVALSLDLTAFGEKRPDLATEEGRARLYSNIAHFMRFVAPEHRSEVQLPSDNGGGRAYPLFLSGKNGATNWDAKVSGKDWAADMRSRFAQEFGQGASGATLLFVGDSSFADMGDDFAAVLPAQPNQKGTGFLATAVVCPGLIAGKTVLQRRDGETFRAGWESAANANWIVLDSWNDFGRATEITASRQHGGRYLDLLRIALAQRYQKAEQGVKWMSQTAPRRLALGQNAQVDVTLQNIARLPLRGADGISLAYRWIKNGRVVGQILLPQPLRVTVFPGDLATLPLNVVAAAQSKEGRILPLTPGDYYLQIDLLQRKPGEAAGRYFSDDGLHSLTVPVQITNQADETVEWNGTSGNPLLFSGGYYPTLLRIRWMGKEPLTPADAQVAYQILSEDGTQTIAAGAFPLDTSLTPGRWATVRAPLRLSDAGGTALAPALPEGANRAESGGYYRVRWLLTRTNATTALGGEYLETIAVYPSDDEARVLPPKERIDTLAANDRTTVNVTVINRGFNRWAKGTAYIGYHWYYADGIEAQWKPVLLAKIEQNVEPGQSVVVPVPIIAPERPGAYTVTFDVTRNNPDNYLSTHPITRIGDIALAVVHVTDGRLTFVNLGKLFDTDAVAYEGKPKDGDLNGVGSTLPGEFFVPDRFGVNAQTILTRTTTDKNGKSRTKTTTLPPPSYPSGYYSEVSAARMASFLFGEIYDGAKNALGANGQKIGVPTSHYVGLHIAALAVGGEDRPMPLVLRYKDNSEQMVSAVVGDWGRSSTNSEPAAIACPIRRTPNGDTAVPSTVYHLILPVNVAKELVSITLPKDPKIKVFAVTLEK